ncbi:hypothetical protein [Actinacidiphila oryziradicis]|uniref:Uncharacterized protein n=1 Tax=Actinacidiphila oryziradicis TaxID=2571141 RepID=A0A4V5N0F7_9ACTN|nr:hypothetical protein [Actinacidiphila oryziradicis]TKA11779.1 hypothetical protein FCI23_10670 [Actinacidiphila oryziradicis]
MAVGEDAHLKGFSGARRAKMWLEGTMRISGAYANTDSASCARRLTLAWPHGGQTFSFDLGGAMRGAPYRGDMFCAEVKNYQHASDQGTQFDEFVAKCYIACQTGHLLSDHLMWITWAPFRANSWAQLDSPKHVESAVLQHRDRVFGTDDMAVARSRMAPEVVEMVADRLWLIVLSEKQETLVPLKDWEAIVAAELIRKGEQW